jgi:hypothetical protein
MKAVLTCDDVFDVLTREPFPSGSADDEVVESHLAVCHECRQLAEAFRPAVGLFHESLSAGRDDELPMYRGRLMPIIESLPEVSLITPRKDECSRSEQRHCRSIAIAASLVLVGSVVFAMLVAMPRTGDSVPAASTVRAPQDRDYTLLAALEIPGDCRSMLDISDRALTAEFVCCTKCHHATSRVASTNLSIRKSSAACAACHDRVVGEALSMVAPCNQFCESLLAYAPIHNL